MCTKQIFVEKGHINTTIIFMSVRHKLRFKMSYLNRFHYLIFFGMVNKEFDYDNSNAFASQMSIFSLVCQVLYMQIFFINVLHIFL